MRQQILAEKLVDPIAPRRHRPQGSRARGSSRSLEQQREVAVATVDADAFVKDVKVDDATVKAFYDANHGRVPDARRKRSSST